LETPNAHSRTEMLKLTSAMKAPRLNWHNEVLVMRTHMVLTQLKESSPFKATPAKQVSRLENTELSLRVKIKCNKEAISQDQQSIAGPFDKRQKREEEQMK
jgi:hypothetical protein